LFFAFLDIQGLKLFHFRQQQSNQHVMFKSIGVVIVLFAITQMMSGTFQAFENAATASFEALEAAAVVSKMQLEQAQ